MTDWTRPDADAPLTDDELAEAAYQWKDLARKIRTPPVPPPQEPYQPKRKPHSKKPRKPPVPKLNPEPGRDVW